MTHFLLIALVAAAQQPQVATTAVKVDSETISGLGARNIASVTGTNLSDWWCFEIHSTSTAATTSGVWTSADVTTV